jgi:antitoxin component YwqK of YwqJK toxin-antitoxin module
LWVETIISSMTASKNESEEVVSPKVEWTELEVKALTEVLAKLATVEENMAGKPISKEKAADITLSNVPLEIQFLGRPLPVSPELGAQTCISVVSKMSEKKKKILNQLMVNITNIDENISRDEVWFMSQISPELFPMIKDLENIFPDGTFIYSIKIYDYETIETNRAIEGSLDLSALENTLLKYYQTLYDGFGGENTPAQLLERSNRMSKIKSWFKEKKPDAFSILFYDTEEEVDGQLQCDTTFKDGMKEGLKKEYYENGELKVNEILISSVGLVSGGDSHNDEEGYSGWMTTKSVSEVEEICKKHSVDINHQTHNLIVLHGFGETISVLGEIFPDKTFAWKRTWDLKLNDEQFETLYRQNQGELKEILIKYYKQVLDISEENINDFNLHRVWVSVQLHLIGPALDEILSNLSSTGIVKKHYSRENYTLEANGSHYLYYPRVYLNEGEFDFDGDDWDEQVSVVSKILGDFMDANGNREICQNSYFKEGVCVYEVKSEFDLEALLEPGW